MILASLRNGSEVVKKIKYKLEICSDDSGSERLNISSQKLMFLLTMTMTHTDVQQV